MLPRVAPISFAGANASRVGEVKQEALPLRSRFTPAARCFETVGYDANKQPLAFSKASRRIQPRSPGITAHYRNNLKPVFAWREFTELTQNASTGFRVNIVSYCAHQLDSAQNNAVSIMSQNRN